MQLSQLNRKDPKTGAMVPPGADTERAGIRPQATQSGSFKEALGPWLSCLGDRGKKGGWQPYLLSVMLYTSAELVSPVSVTPVATKMRPSWMVAPKSDRAVCMGASSFHSNFLGS